MKSTVACDIQYLCVVHPSYIYFYSPDNLLDEASPETGSASGVYWASAQRQTHLSTTLFVVCSNCWLSWHKLLLSSLFHQLIMRHSEKKWCLRFVHFLLFFNFQGWPLVRLSVSNTKKVSSDNYYKPWVSLNTSIKSARIRWSSNEFFQPVFICNGLQTCIICANLCWTFSVNSLSLA